MYVFYTGLAEYLWQFKDCCLKHLLIMTPLKVIYYCYLNFNCPTFYFLDAGQLASNLKKSASLSVHPNFLSFSSKKHLQNNQYDQNYTCQLCIVSISFKKNLFYESFSFLVVLQLQRICVIRVSNSFDSILFQ